MNKLEILYEDNHLLVVIKPVNMLSQSDATGDMDLLTIVKKYVKEKYHKPGNVYIGLVHRLDRPVGGIMVFARTSKAAARLSKQIQAHQFEKKYLAIVHGILQNKQDTLLDYVEKGEDGTSRIVSSAFGKQAVLSYKVQKERTDLNLSFLSISLKTGRHHQIRVQFASRGFPLYGDQRYGKQDQKQITLYASMLKFIHPITGQVLSFSHLPEAINGWSFFL